MHVAMGCPRSLCPAVLTGDATAIRASDVTILTDHGNDPTTPSTGPLPRARAAAGVWTAHPAECELGDRATFADVAATIADLLDIHVDRAGSKFCAGGAGLMAELSEGVIPVITPVGHGWRLALTVIPPSLGTIYLGGGIFYGLALGWEEELGWLTFGLLTFVMVLGLVVDGLAGHFGAKLGGASCLGLCRHSGWVLSWPYRQFELAHRC